MAAVAAVGAAPPALTSAQSSGGRDITVRDKVQSIRFVHQKRTKTDDRLATGDRVLTHQRLFDETNKTIGTLLTDCVNVAPPRASFQRRCSARRPTSPPTANSSRLV